MTTFDEAFDALMVIEVGHDPANPSGYVNDPLDPGGETCWGVTARVARAHGYVGAMKDLARDTAKEIAHGAYWIPTSCDELPDAIRFDVFDAAYNSGVREAIVMLQHAVGVPADGAYGVYTGTVLAGMDPERVRRVFNSIRLSFYTSLPGWEHDGKGWANRIAENLKR